MDCPTSTIDLTNICSQAMGIALDVTGQLLINYFLKWCIHHFHFTLPKKKNIIYNLESFST